MLWLIEYKKQYTVFNDETYNKQEILKPLGTRDDAEIYVMLHTQGDVKESNDYTDWKYMLSNFSVQYINQGAEALRDKLKELNFDDEAIEFAVNDMEQRKKR